MAKNERESHPSDFAGFLPGHWRRGEDNAGVTHERGGSSPEEAHRRLEEEIAEANAELEEDDDDDDDEE